MDVCFVQHDCVTGHEVGDVEALLAREDGFVWVDVPEWSEAAEHLLRDVLHCHPLVLDACRTRNHVPTVHRYPEHVFVVVHAPLAGEGGHVHLLELDQLVGTRYLVTVHGPRNPVVSEDEVTRETVATRYRIEHGRFHPGSPAELSYAIGSAIARRQRALVSEVAERLPELEKEVMGSNFRRPEELLDKLFLLRHMLLTARTMAAQSADMYARIQSLERLVAEVDRGFAKDLTEQFDRVRSVADGESQFLFGVIDLYQTRVTTKMTVAMERLAVIAAITLPVTAIASVYGMNVIVNQSTHVGQLLVVLAVMLAISGVLLRWTKRQGWW